MAVEFFKRAQQADSDGEPLFAIYDLVVCITGGPCMTITKWVGEDHAECFFFTDTGVPFVKNFPLAILESWEDVSS